MNRYSHPIALLFCAALVGCTATHLKGTSSAETPSKAQGDVRTTNLKNNATPAYFEAQQQRLQKLSEAGNSAKDYQFAKAQCWLEFALDEYHDNDRSGVIEAASEQAESLISALEQGRQLPMDTPILQGDSKVREDLWTKVQQLKQGPGFLCAQHTIACLEVKLSEAGHEYAELGWRHAKSAIEVAEEMTRVAEQQTAGCTK